MSKRFMSVLMALWKTAVARNRHLFRIGLVEFSTADKLVFQIFGKSILIIPPKFDFIIRFENFLLKLIVNAF